MSNLFRVVGRLLPDSNITGESLASVATRVHSFYGEEFHAVYFKQRGCELIAILNERSTFLVDVGLAVDLLRKFEPELHYSTEYQPEDSDEWYDTFRLDCKVDELICV